MGFNLFLYAFIIFGMAVAKSFDYEPPTNENESED